MNDDTDTSKAEAAAEKAYAEASANVEAAPAPLPVAEKPAPAAPKAAKATTKRSVAKSAQAKAAPVKAEPAKGEAAKPVAAAPRRKAGAKPAPAKAAKPVKQKPAVKPAPKFKTRVNPAAPAPTPSIKDVFAMTTTTEFTTKMQDAMKDAAARAKAMMEKGQASFADMPEFAKGNVEAMVESTKILAAGLQDMGKTYVAESKSAFETMTADVKDLAAVSSPTEFFEKQSALARKNFDAAVAASSKSSEAMLKLVSEAFQPLSTRMSLAVEKMKQAA